MNDNFITQCKRLKLEKPKYLRVILSENDENCLDKIAQELCGDIGIVELYGRNVPAYMFLSLAQKVKQLCAEFEKTLIINDRLDIAIIAEADGIFLTSADIPKSYVTKVLPKDTIIGTDNLNCTNADYYLSDNSTESHNTKPCFIKTNTLDNFVYYTHSN